jgi:hypothetical protein
MRIYCDPGVPKWIRNLCQSFLKDWYDPQKHTNPLKVRLIHAGFLVIPICGCAYGAFNVRKWPPSSTRVGAKIYVASAWRYWHCSKQEATREILYTLAHECVHYEKWVAYGSNTHRGLPQRVNKLMRAYLTKHPL